MLMQLCELKYRASMKADPVWERRYRCALQYMLRDPVNIDEIDRILGSSKGFTDCSLSKEVPVIEYPKQETWRDRMMREPLL